MGRKVLILPIFLFYKFLKKYNFLRVPDALEDVSETEACLVPIENCRDVCSYLVSFFGKITFLKLIFMIRLKHISKKFLPRPFSENFCIIGFECAKTNSFLILILASPNRQ